MISGVLEGKIGNIVQGCMTPKTLSWNIVPAVYNPTLSGIAGSALVFNVRTGQKQTKKHDTNIQIGRDLSKEAENNFTE